MNDDNPVQIGDLVALRGSSITMTVENVKGTAPYVDCVWFSAGEVRRSTFNAKILRRVGHDSA